MKKGDKVIHEGKEKIIEDIVGEVLILDDHLTVGIEDVSIIPEPENTEEEKIALRTRINGIEDNIIASDLMAIMNDTNTNWSELPLLENRSIDIVALKSILLSNAISSSKISPSICEACGQRISE